MAVIIRTLPNPGRFGPKEFFVLLDSTELRETDASPAPFLLNLPSYIGDGLSASDVSRLIRLTGGLYTDVSEAEKAEKAVRRIFAKYA